MLFLDIFGGILLATQLVLYNRVLPLFTAYVLGNEYKPKIAGIAIAFLYGFNLLMLISSAAKTYTGFRSSDEKEKRHHYAMVLAGIVIVMLFNILAEVLMVRFRFTVR